MSLCSLRGSRRFSTARAHRPSSLLYPRSWFTVSSLSVPCPWKAHPSHRRTCCRPLPAHPCTQKLLHFLGEMSATPRSRAPRDHLESPLQIPEQPLAAHALLPNPCPRQRRLEKEAGKPSGERKSSETQESTWRAEEETEQVAVVNNNRGEGQSRAESSNGWR